MSAFSGAKALKHSCCDNEEQPNGNKVQLPKRYVPKVAETKPSWKICTKPLQKSLQKYKPLQALNPNQGVKNRSSDLSFDRLDPLENSHATKNERWTECREERWKPFWIEWASMPPWVYGISQCVCVHIDILMWYNSSTYFHGCRPRACNLFFPGEGALNETWHFTMLI